MKIFFYPEEPKRFALWENKVLRYCQSLNIKMTSSLVSDFDAVMFWSYNKGLWEPDSVYKVLCENHDVINARCYDARKTYNEKVMMDVFGYNSIADSSYTGRVLKKSIYQGEHDMTPVESVGDEDGYIYVKEIDNTDGKRVVDYRIYVFDDFIPFVIVKDKPIRKRYGGASKARLSVCDAYYYFEPDEIKNILSYCKQYGSHITELDVLRDNTDGRIYVVDNNNIAGLSKRVNRLLIKNNLWDYLSHLFYTTVKSHST